MKFDLPSGLLKCPPLLDSAYFGEWKNYTKSLIRMEHPQLWEIIENGPLKITKEDENGRIVEKENRDDWNEVDYDKCRKNARALHILYCALSLDDFYRVSACKTAKEVWDALNHTFEDAVYQSTNLANLLRKTSLHETSFESRKWQKGYSTLHHPKLSRENFQQWKARIRAFIESYDPQVWHIIENGPLKVTKLDDNGLLVEKQRDEMDENDYDKLSKNSRAKLTLIYGSEDVSGMMGYNFETAKAFWKGLNDCFEGDEDTKQIKIYTLEIQYKSFKMKKDESIKEMFSRFITLVGKLALLGEEVSICAQVRKILRSLPREYEKFITLTPWAKMSLNELFGRLLVYEEQLGQTGKAFWKALNDCFEGDEGTKQIRIYKLEIEYESFKMKKDESIKEMFSRFVTLVGKLALLGEEVSTRAQVRKILRSLPREEYENFVTLIHLGTPWAKMSLNELFARLLVYEEELGSKEKALVLFACRANC